MPFMVSSLGSQLSYHQAFDFSLFRFFRFSNSLFSLIVIIFGGSRKVAICLGTGKLAKVPLLSFFPNSNVMQALKSINKTHSFFDTILEVEHPRYIIQYKHSSIQTYPHFTFPSFFF